MTRSSTDTTSTQETSTDIEPARFRDAVGHYASGITIVTGHDAHGPIGFTCQSFYSVSVDPPLVSFSVMGSSTTYPRIRDTGRFAVNILSTDQVTASNQFARRGTDKWAGITWQPTRRGNPILEQTRAWLDCVIVAEHDAGDHLIVIGRVTELGPSEGGTVDPLLYYRGQYRALEAS